MTTITITPDTTSLQTIAGHVSNPSERRELFAMIRGAMKNSLKKAALAKKKSGFWLEVAKTVTGESDANSAIAGATHPAAAIRQFGGTISAPGQDSLATGAKYLSIPVSDRAKGKSPKQFPDLFFVMASGGGKYLFDAAHEGELMYVLKKSVTHPADPWVPSESQIGKDLRKATKAWLDSRKRN